MQEGFQVLGLLGLLMQMEMQIGLHQQHQHQQQQQKEQQQQQLLTRSFPGAPRWSSRRASC